jgi:Ran-interacting Mog1 protein
MSSTYQLRPLFGGAMTIELPADSQTWRDVSEVRQIPDHQECFQEINTPTTTSGSSTAGSHHPKGRVLVVEILERPEGISDLDTASYFFHDLASTNSADITTTATVLPSTSFTSVPSPDWLSKAGLPLSSSSTPIIYCTGFGYQPVPIAESHGATNSAVEEWIRVDLGVIRLLSVNTDLLVTLSTPQSSLPVTSETAVAPSQPAEVFTRAFTTLQVRDWSLFRQ